MVRMIQVDACTLMKIFPKLHLLRFVLFEFVCRAYLFMVGYWYLESSVNILIACEHYDWLVVLVQ
uniref:Uncharacterized protein n=1 Tax=Rhizophora mucronata TaxID=61149 RepID=A0A2P2QUL6_RHIMU